MSQPNAYSQSPSEKQPSLSKDVVEVGKLLKCYELNATNEAIAKWSEIATKRPKSADSLLAKVGVCRQSPEGPCELIPGPRFTHSEKIKNSFLTYALLGLLSKAPNGTRAAYLREQVSRIEAITPDVPFLAGFNSLRIIDITVDMSLHYPIESPKGLSANWQERFYDLPRLTNVKLAINAKLFSPYSLDPFCSPFLESITIDDEWLQGLEGLECSNVLSEVRIDMGNKTQDRCIALSPLASSKESLRVLDIRGAGIDDLTPIREHTLLHELSADFFRVSDLRSLPAILGDTLTLRLHSHPNEPASLTGIERQKVVKNLHLYGSFDNLDPLNSLPSVISLGIGGDRLTEITSLSGLQSLRKVQIGSDSLKSLPNAWPNNLEVLDITYCAGLVSLGRLPSTLQGTIDCVFCPSLESLSGIEACTCLSEIKLSVRKVAKPSWREPVPDVEPHMDISAAGKLPNLWITLLCWDTGNLSSLPFGWVSQLAQMSSCKIRLKGQHLDNIELLAKIRSLAALDISDVSVADISAILRMNNLEELRINPASDFSRKLGAWVLNKESIGELKLLMMAGM